MKSEFNINPDSGASVPLLKKSFVFFLADEIGRKTASFGNSFSKAKSFNLFKFKLPKPAILIIIAVIVVAGIIFLVKTTSQNTQPASSAKPLAPTIIANQNINKEFDFPIKDASGKELSKIKYVVQSAALQNEILVKGERARAVQGRVFLILNLMITNNYKQGIQINSRDYIRLIVDGKKDELLAADIHNDPVEVQAISTKATKIGFPIDENYKSLEIQVGEINGTKESIKISFPNR